MVMKESRRTKSAPTETRAEAPTREEIAQRAYEIYLTRGGVSGQEEDDWYQAERELRAARGRSKGGKAAGV